MMAIFFTSAASAVPITAKAPVASTAAMAVAVINRLEILVMVEASSFPRFVVTHAYSAALI
jgi:hypothetical protein